MQFILDILGKIGFEWQMGLFNLVNFLIIFLILKRFFFKPIVNVINERQARADEAVENFTKAKTEVSMATQKAQELIDHAKVDANRIIEKAGVEAKEQGEKIKEKAKDEVELLVRQVKKNIEIDKKQMKEEIKKETAALVVLAVEKILEEKIDPKKDGVLIDRALSKVS